MAEQKQENSSKIRNIISTEISRLLRLSGVHSGKIMKCLALNASHNFKNRSESEVTAEQIN